jgi:predicted DNA-binding transcriptional regulator AlpA
LVLLVSKAALKQPVYSGVCAPRGLRREAAAAYVGVSPSTFDQWVVEGAMPQPKRRGGVVVWDRWALDTAFDALDGDANDDATDRFFA